MHDRIKWWHKKWCVNNFQIGLTCHCVAQWLYRLNVFFFVFLFLHSPVHQHPEEESVVKIIQNLLFYFASVWCVSGKLPYVFGYVKLEVLNVCFFEYVNKSWVLIYFWFGEYYLHILVLKPKGNWYLYKCQCRVWTEWFQQV